MSEANSSHDLAQRWEEGELPLTAITNKTKRRRKKKRPPPIECCTPTSPSAVTPLLVSALATDRRASLNRRNSAVILSEQQFLLASNTVPVPLDASFENPVVSRLLLKIGGDSFPPQRVSETASLEPAVKAEPNSPIPPVPKTPVSAQTDEQVQSFSAYIKAEAQPAEKLPTADVVWGQTEREKVYNFLLHVPYQLERVLAFGALICFDSFLAVITLIPTRALYAIGQGIRSIFLHKKRPTVCGSQLYDVICFIILLASSWCLLLLKPGIIYYWMKDITSEFLKIQVVFSALEILDKILTNFGVDVMEALSSTCTLYVAGTKSIYALLSDTLIAFILCTMHGVDLMAQGIVISVAMNSKKNALVALLIAANFVEIKGTITKRMDANKIWTLVCLDIVERFHLVAILLFVAVEDMASSANYVPSSATLLDCGRIIGSEVIIDIMKHSVLGKFNDIRPGIYREYMKDVCSSLHGAQSHSCHKMFVFFPLGPALLIIRVGCTIINMDRTGWRSWWIAGLLWASLLMLRPLFGYVLKMWASQYVAHYNAQHAKHGHRMAKPRPKVD